MFKKTLCLLAFAVTMLPVISTLCQTAPEIVVERGVAMTTRDGVKLRADIYRPAGEGTFPVLLAAHALQQDWQADFGRKAAAHGYMVVVQDVRGRYTSEGEWYTFKHETEDGYDAVEWAAALPHSNGKVGMFGGSYVGATQMLAAIGQSSASGRNLPRRHRLQLPRKLDLSGRRLRAVVQRVLDLRPRSGHSQPADQAGTNALIGSTICP